MTIRVRLPHERIVNSPAMRAAPTTANAQLSPTHGLPIAFIQKRLKYKWKLRMLPLSPLAGRLSLISLFLAFSIISSALNAEDLMPELTDQAAWAALPIASKDDGTKLPQWARKLASVLPKSTAAMLELDYAQRAGNPIPPRLRAAMRWVIARANQSHYGEQIAEADGRGAGLDEAKLRGLKSGVYDGWSRAEQVALDFAQRMTVASHSITDEEFAQLVREFGDRQAASMVLLSAYGNMQDRLLICLQCEHEWEPQAVGPLAVTFAPEAFVIHQVHPRPVNPDLGSVGHAPANLSISEERSAETYESLQQLLRLQREKPTRLRVPDWDEVTPGLPEGPMRRHSDIVWYRIVFGYSPELAVPFERFMRTLGAETAPDFDRMFGITLFWVTTQAMKCPYCMGHCEMIWEVAGLSPDGIAARSRILASDDWSAFPVAEQRAFAFASKVTRTPGAIDRVELQNLYDDLGNRRAMCVIAQTCRYNYMTRISNGFQLTLESENVFFDYWNKSRPAAIQGGAFVTIPSDEDAWARLPETTSGGTGPLPNWAKAMAMHLPRTAAAMLKLDEAQRTRSGLDPVLRTKMRWVVAHANRCRYSEAYAIADLRRAGADESVIRNLIGSQQDWPDSDRDPLEFARLLTVAAPTINDELFERLRAGYGEEKVASMILLAAYGNFQDRFVLGLNLPLEQDGPLEPPSVEFAPGALQLASLMPAEADDVGELVTGESVVAILPTWDDIPYEELQLRLQRQRDRKSRLPVPTWEQAREHLPAAMATRPTRIAWTLTCYGYAPELAVPWAITTRTHWAEAPAGRIFEESLFWVQTRAVECNYCMGHCEMLMEVAGMTKETIAHRTRLLAESDWSAFPAAEQRAYAYARKLTHTPWEMTHDDYQTLVKDQGAQQAMSIFFWLCRGLYMTRISDGFQLSLERENVFASPPHLQTAKDANE
jgi:alkylhydroperoxidase family enzyme